ncbi:NUDIX domain-containing protein [Streptomyces pinistramenti]|uniref:NUDIX domain-containing protein n=1 Tax=Streptomyces pinistramenti TaxID=2884812 RepID=UPI001D075E06|nr:NUDIX hydrolase [Streptomyces pinistramenti]MCB5908091.1 NUDIX hydrolase [Streptomyces pinistramenti]
MTSAAAAFIQRADGRVLLVHHAGTGYWVAPGGKTDEHETPFQCCEREAREETGVPVTPGRLLVVQWLPGGQLGTYKNPFPCHLFLFAATIAPQDVDRIQVPERELLGWKWVDPDHAPALMDDTNAALFTAAVKVTSGAAAAPVYLEGRHAPTAVPAVE